MLFIQVVGAFFAVFTIAVLNGVPKHFLLYSGLVGAAGWGIYLLLLRIGLTETLSMFFAALVVAMVSHIFARVRKAPVTLFLVCGILPLVPGVAMYRIVYYLMRSDTITAGHYAMTTVKITGTIALAVFLVDTGFKLIKARFWATEFRTPKSKLQRKTVKTKETQV